MEKVKQGVLYLVSTPIGNLEDVTLRALRTLKEVDLIAAEDTRRTRKLLSHYDIHTPLTSYYEGNCLAKGEYLVRLLAEGKKVAFVSDAGTPGISDPGYRIVQEVLSAGVPLVPIPGPTASITALVISGLPTHHFVFLGFLSSRQRERKKQLLNLKNETKTIVLYEAPHRLLKTLEDVLDVLGNRRIAAVREVTKKFEELKRGSVKEVLKHFKLNKPRGEFCLVLEGSTEKVLPAKDWEKETVGEHLKRTMAERGLAKKEAIRAVAKERGLPKREVYKISIGKAFHL